MRRVIVGAVVKSIPILLLGMMAMHEAGKARSASVSAYSRFIGFGLVLGSIGDLLLDLAALKEQAFLVGLASFLFGHIWYIAAFAQAELRHSAAVAVPFVVFPCFILYTLYPHLQADMRIPVMVYGCVIGAMGYFSAIRTRVPSLNFFLSFLGAMVFVVSDTLLAFGKFKTPIPYGKLWVMLTYYAAQILTAQAVPSMVAADIKHADSAVGKKDDSSTGDAVADAPSTGSKRQGKRTPKRS